MSLPCSIGSRPRPRLATACGVACLLAACDDSTAPNGAVGFFRLETVNSVAVPYVSPPSSSNPFVSIAGGQLLLRRNGTFTLAIEGMAWLFEGTYSRAGDELRLAVPNGDPSQPPIVFTSPFSLDSVRIALEQPPLVFVFRSNPLPPASIRTSLWLLTEANGRRGKPIVVIDTVIDRTRYVYRIEFDSLWLRDGVFFRQSRAESATAYLTTGDSVRDADFSLSFGSYTSDASWVVLRRYFTSLPSQMPVDSLAISDGRLTRVTRLRTGDRVERYSVAR